MNMRNMRNNRWVRTLLLCGFGIAYVSVGCAFSNSVFHVSRTKMRRQIYSGNHEFLRGIEYDKHNINEAGRLHAGGRYYLSQVYRSLGLHAVSDIFLRAGWAHERAPWRYKAGLDILAKLSARRDYRSAERVAQQGLQAFPNDREYLYYYLESLYWQRQYRDTLALLDDFRAQLDFEQSYPISRTRKNSSEAQLWEAVTLYRGAIGDYHSKFKELFFAYSANSHHFRAYDYIVDEPRLRASFAAWELSFFNAKQLTNARSYAAAAKSYEAAFGGMSLAERTQALTPRTVRDIGRAYFYGGYGKTGKERLQELSHQLGGASRAMALEWLGRLHIRSQQYAQAQEALHKAHRQRSSDRVLWLAFDAAFSQSTADGLDSMQKYGRHVDDKRYYSDLFDRETSRAVREDRWGDLWRLRTIAIQYGAPYDRARLAVVVAEGVRVGATTLSPGVTMSQLRLELEHARRQTQSAHYAHLAGFLIGKRVTTRTFPPRDRAPRISSHSRPSCTGLIDGYWQFHLIRQGYEQLRECANHYQTDELVDVAKELYSRKIFNYAMRILDIARSRKDFVLTDSIARVLYPRAYSQFIDRIAKQNGLSSYFFYATIREESYFTHTISSHAGAVGLGQFIPRTARAVARQINLKNVDLTDPEQNLTLSGFHLRDLINALDNKQLFALAGYNAGLGRARRWLRIYDDYSDLLKHEAIQFTETRHYIRKILVTNIQYARLYENLPAATVIREHFTDLGRL